MKKGKIVRCKPKFNPFTKKLIMNSGGFPDFIAIKKVGEMYDVVGVEVKTNGKLSKDEKEKCKFLLDRGVFSSILVAKAVKDGRKINVEYDDFKERFGKLWNEKR